MSLKSRDMILFISLLSERDIINFFPIFSENGKPGIKTLLLFFSTSEDNFSHPQSHIKSLESYTPQKE